MTLGEREAHIVIRSRWMGADDWSRRCELLRTHRQLDSHHGVLQVAGAATASPCGRPRAACTALTPAGG